MIFLQQNTGITLYFPKSMTDDYSSYTLTLHSEITDDKFEYEGIANSGDLIDYYTFTIDTTNIPTGEYTGEVNGLSKCLIQVGDRDVNAKTQYSRNNNNVQYELD